MVEKISYDVFISLSSFGLINGSSEIIFSLNLSMFFWVNNLTKGLSLMVGVLMSIRVKFERWSDILVIRLPDEHLLWINFFGVLIKMWSKSVAE